MTNEQNMNLESEKSIEGRVFDVSFAFLGILRSFVIGHCVIGHSLGPPCEAATCLTTVC